MVPTFSGFESQLRAVFGICYPSSSETMNPHHSPVVPVEPDNNMHLPNKVSTNQFPSLADQVQHYNCQHTCILEMP